MSSRSQILKDVLANQPALMPIGDAVMISRLDKLSLVDQFALSLSLIGGRATLLEDVQTPIFQDPEDAATVYVRASVGVAENGAVWVDDGSLPDRLMPFLCEHLKVVINASSIVADLHDAYKRINLTGIGFGSFIAGPSKTADIEQSLVIGAHGAKTCEVLIIKNK